MSTYMFTINNPTEEDTPLLWETKYIIYQKERGQEGTVHLQGYVIFKKAMRISALKKINARAHWEKRRGTHEQAKAYCSKEDTRIEGPFAQGEEPAQGKRSDLLEIKEKLDQGVSMKEIAADHYGSWCRYRQSFAAYRQLSQPERNFKTQVFVLWGNTGVGKSKFVADSAAKVEESIYWKPQGQWWDGYNNEIHCCLDDFYGGIKYTDMLRLLDRYPFQVEVKGGYVQFNSKYIWITSNKHPNQWYAKEEGYPALERRFDVIARMLEGGELVYEKGAPQVE